MKAIGTDIVDIDRIAEKVQNMAFRDKVFAPAEIRYCESQAFPPQHFAARFAAKEALLKAMGVDYILQWNWTDIVVQNEPNGKPFITLEGEPAQAFRERGFDTIHLSLSHTRSAAVAFIVLL
jgi:holo-[acyl-carrier protein] synthase